MKDNNLEVALVYSACPICGEKDEESGTVIMNSLLTKGMAEKIKRMHNQIVDINSEPCNKCKEYAKQGIIVVTIDPEKTRAHNKEGISMLENEFSNTYKQDAKKYLRNKIDRISRNIDTYNPYRTGFFVIKEEAAMRIFDKISAKEEIMEKRMCFLEDKVAREILGFFDRQKEEDATSE